MELPRVDIVILNWNGLADTLDCLASIRQLAYPNVRVQLVDNASANDEAGKIKNEFPEINVLRLKKNLGFCGGCNAGMQNALDENADYILLLNNDTLLAPDLIGKLVSNYGELENPGAISPVILNFPEKEKVWFSMARWETHWKRGEAEFRLSYNEKYDDIRSKRPYETEFACGCCLFVSAKVVKEVGLFDERYFAFYDEAEWCARMKKKGFISYVIPSAYMYHKIGGSTPNLVMTYLLSRNRLLWMAEYLPFGKKLKSWPCLLKELFWHWLNVLGFFRKEKRHVSKQQSRAFLRGWKDYLLGRFGQWNKSTEKIILNNL